MIGEGELTVLELMDAIGGGRLFSSVQGVAFRDGDQCVVNARRPLISDVDSIPMPAYDLFPIEYYRLSRIAHIDNSDFAMPVLSGRGCTFGCTFCYRMDKGFRPRSNDAIIEEIHLLKDKYGVTYVSFSDELLMSSVERTVGLCEDFIRAELHVRWDCNGRLNYAQPPVLEIMRRAGCVFINYGIEAMDDEVLRQMRKHLTTRQIISGVEATIAAGISPGLNILFGSVGDNAGTLLKAVDFLKRYDDGAQMRTIRPVTPYPGSPLYYQAIEQEMLGGVEDFYEQKHTNSDLMTVNFTELSDDEFYRALTEANIALVDNYFAKKRESTAAQVRDLYGNRDASFRGFRQS